MTIFIYNNRKGPIDISANIIPGKNELEIVQISGTPDYNFVVTASHPSLQELTHSRRGKKLTQAIRTWGVSGV